MRRYAASSSSNFTSTFGAVTAPRLLNSSSFQDKTFAENDSVCILLIMYFRYAEHSKTFSKIIACITTREETTKYLTDSLCNVQCFSKSDQLHRFVVLWSKILAASYQQVSQHKLCVVSPPASQDAEKTHPVVCVPPAINTCSAVWS